MNKTAFMRGYINSIPTKGQNLIMNKIAMEKIAIDDNTSSPIISKDVGFNKDFKDYTTDKGIGTWTSNEGGGSKWSGGKDAKSVYGSAKMNYDAQGYIGDHTKMPEKNRSSNSTEGYASMNPLTKSTGYGKENGTAQTYGTSGDNKENYGRMDKRLDQLNAKTDKIDREIANGTRQVADPFARRTQYVPATPGPVDIGNDDQASQNAWSDSKKATENFKRYSNNRVKNDKYGANIYNDAGDSYSSSYTDWKNNVAKKDGVDANGEWQNGYDSTEEEYAAYAKYNNKNITDQKAINETASNTMQQVGEAQDNRVQASVPKPTNTPPPVLEDTSRVANQAIEHEQAILDRTAQKAAQTQARNIQNRHQKIDSMNQADADPNTPYEDLTPMQRAQADAAEAGRNGESFDPEVYDGPMPDIKSKMSDYESATEADYNDLLGEYAPTAQDKTMDAQDAHQADLAKQKKVDEDNRAEMYRRVMEQQKANVNYKVNNIPYFHNPVKRGGEKMHNINFKWSNIPGVVQQPNKQKGQINTNYYNQWR